MGWVEVHTGSAGDEGLRGKGACFQASVSRINRHQYFVISIKWSVTFKNCIKK